MTTDSDRQAHLASVKHHRDQLAWTLTALQRTEEWTEDVALTLAGYGLAGEQTAHAHEKAAEARAAGKALVTSMGLLIAALEALNTESTG